MYQCHTTMNIIGSLEHLGNIISNIQPFSNFTFEIIHSDKIGHSDISASDFVFINTENESPSELLSVIKADKKEKAKIILCMPVCDKDIYFNMDLPDIYDVWIMPQNDSELTFRFQQLMKLWKEEMDFWLTQNYLDSTIDSFPGLVWYKDKEGAHLKVNCQFCKTVNKTKEQIQGRGHYYIWDIDPDEYAKGEFICMESEIEVMEKRKTCIFDEIVKVGDEFRRFKTYKSPLFNPDGSIMGTVGVALDVTQETLYKDEIIKKSNTDFLTGLYNRRYLTQYIEEKEKGSPITAFYLDLDNFKSVNDTYGHKAGDDALLLTRDILNKCMSECVISRIGGDEFFIIDMKEYTKEELEKKRLWLEKQLFDAYQKVPNFHTLSVSIGCACGVTSADILDELLTRADRRMYYDKNRKKRKHSQ